MSSAASSARARASPHLLSRREPVREHAFPRVAPRRRRHAAAAASLSSVDGVSDGPPRTTRFGASDARSPSPLRRRRSGKTRPRRRRPRLFPAKTCLRCAARPRTSASAATVTARTVRGCAAPAPSRPPRRKTPAAAAPACVAAEEYARRRASGARGPWFTEAFRERHDAGEVRDGRDARDARAADGRERGASSFAVGVCAWRGPRAAGAKYAAGARGRHDLVRSNPGTGARPPSMTSTWSSVPSRRRSTAKSRSRDVVRRARRRRRDRYLAVQFGVAIEIERAITDRAKSPSSVGCHVSR